MGNRKQFIIAASMSALLSATTWAQMPYGDTTRSDTTRGDTMRGDTTSQSIKGSQARNTQDRNTQDRNTQDRNASSYDSATHGKGVTASDQSNDKDDVSITTKIRKEIVAKKGMSVAAQNVKIVTIDGKVSLKGEVKSANEKETIEKIATKVAGSNNVTNDLQVR